MSQDDDKHAIGLYAVGARDVSDFIDMIREEDTSTRSLKLLREMLASPGTANTDVELNKLLLPIVDRELARRSNKLWRVRFEMSRVVEIRGAESGAEAEEKARDQALFHDEPPIDREDIDSINVAWVNEEVDLEHVDGCAGNHCRHYDCFTGDDAQGADDYHEYCVNCDPE